MSKCQICEENFTTVKRKVIRCKNCNKICCSECYKTYILQSNLNCMFCNIPKTIWEITEELEPSKAFIDKIFEKERDIFFQKEKKNLKKYLDFEETVSQRSISRKKYNKQIKSLEEKIYIMRCELFQKRNDFQKLENDYSKQLEKIRKIDQCETINIKCYNKDCIGYINNDNFCNICKETFCDKCHKKYTEDHICKKEDIETIEYINNNTKPCPTCGERISKISGCDQMYCDPKENGIGCGTVFSYKTGKKEYGNIHNPHFIERKNKINNSQLMNAEFDIFNFTNESDWTIQFQTDILSHYLIPVFRFLWRQRFAGKKIIEEKFSKDIIKDEVFCIGLNNRDEQEEWKKKLVPIVKKKELFQLVIKEYENVVLEIEKCIYEIISIFRKKEISINFLNYIFKKIQYSADECNKNIIEKHKYISCKKYVIKYKFIKFKDINYCTVF